MHGFIQGGHAWFYPGGHAWFYPGGVHGFIQGGMRGFIWGGMLVLFGGRAWFYRGGACVVLSGRGACLVLFRGGGGGHAWFYLGGHAWFYPGRGGVRVFSSFFGYNEIRSMSGRYASYWNAFLLPNMTSQLVNELSIKHCLGVCEQNRIVNSVHVDGWTIA